MAENDSRNQYYYQSGKQRGFSHYYAQPLPNPAYENLIIPPLREGIATEVNLAPDQPAFQSVQTNEFIAGLQEHIFTHWEGIPTYIFGQHNFAHFALAEAIRVHDINTEAVLINFDTHPDHEDAPSHLTQRERQSLRRVSEYTNELLIDNFIEASAVHEFISGAVWVHPLYRPEHDEESMFASFPFVQAGKDSEAFRRILHGDIPKEELVVSIDIDYFVFWADQLLHSTDIPFENRYPNMTNEQIVDAEIAFLREIMQHAGLIILATSPGFIDQEKAIEIVKRLLAPLPN